MRKQENKEIKKILIVNDNLHIGGIQKSLINLLNEINNDYNITVLLLNKNGKLLSEVPKNVNVISACKMLEVMGAHKKELESKKLKYLWKGILIVFSKIFSKKTVFILASIFQKNVKGFDVAISFSHPSKNHNLRSCSAEFVLNKTKAKEKVCFIHGDYKNEDNRCIYTDSLYTKFDKLACCSNSVRKHFLEVLPELEEKAFVVRNFYDLSLLNLKKNNNIFLYDEEYINIVSVARLTLEKGVERVVEALYESRRKDIRYYIVGDGPEKSNIEQRIKEYELENQVFLMGETDKPYVYMKKADYLIVPSFHEAAPMVFDEARLLGLKVITTNTTSANEMVGDYGGIVCDNSNNGIKDVLFTLTKNTEILDEKIFNNDIQKGQFINII